MRNLFPFLLLVTSALAAVETPTTRGNAAMESGKHAEAIAAYTEAIEQEPQKADHYLDRSIAYDAAGETDKAIADADKRSSSTGRIRSATRCAPGSNTPSGRLRMSSPTLPKLSS